MYILEVLDEPLSRTSFSNIFLSEPYSFFDRDIDTTVIFLYYFTGI